MHLGERGLPDSAAPAVSDGSRERLAGERYRQLLFINEYPPSTAGGAPITARQLFRRYDPARMDVLCCASWYDRVPQQVRDTFLACRHTVIPSHRAGRRPQRFFGPIEATLDCLRLKKIMNAARRIVHERKVEALFTTSYGAEMPHAAYFLSRELGLPLYYFEMDRIDTVYSCRCAKKLIVENRLPFLRSLEKLWLISPAMRREFQRAYGVDGEVLLHFIDVAASQAAVRRAPPLPTDRIQLIYTGSVNQMFYDTMRWFCELLNRGLTLDGRPVSMTVYSSFCPPELLGPHVTWPGLVPSDQIAEKLATAHIAVMLISFTEAEGIKQQVETSVYTKGIDYLAASRPVLLVAPPHAGQVESFGAFSCHVDRLDEVQVTAAIRRLLDDVPYADDLRTRGLERVRERHSLEALDRDFLSVFRTSA